MNKRKLNLKKYGISSGRLKELSGFCEQYPEWKSFLEENETALKGIQYSDMPSAHRNSDSTCNIAVKCADTAEKCKLIEETAQEVSGYYAEYIIKNVCYGVSFNYLITMCEMLCSRATFYDERRKFFYLLDKNKKK